MLQLFLVLYLAMPLMMLPVVKRRIPLGALEKNTSLELRGLGMWIIMVAHAVKERSNQATFFFYASAILGVSICFFLSGYGLYKSNMSKPNYLKHFIVPKFFRVLLPYGILFVIVIIYRMANGDSITPHDILYDLIRLQLNGALLWYLKIQLLLYFFFYLIFHFPLKYRAGCLLLLTIAYMIIARCAGLGEVWYNTCLFFPLGVLCGKYEKKVIPLMQRKTIIFIALLFFIIIFGILFFFGRLNIAWLIDNVYMLSFLIFIVGIFSFFSGSILLNDLGKCSMEVYLVHIILLQESLPISKLFNPDKGWTYILLLICTLVISIPLYTLDTWIGKKLFCRRTGN